LDHLWSPFYKYQNSESRNKKFYDHKAWSYSTNVPLSYIILYIYLCIAARVVQSLASSEAMQGINTTLIPRDYPGLCDDVVFDSDAYWSCYVFHSG
jgi:hypothetical protein